MENNNGSQTCNFFIIREELLMILNQRLSSKLISNCELYLRCLFSSFAFIFLPLLAIDHFKTNIRRTLSDKLKFILGFASGILVGLSGVFKVMHLQGTVALLVAGILLCVFGFFPFLFFTMYKKSIT